MHNNVHCSIIAGNGKKNRNNVSFYEQGIRKGDFIIHMLVCHVAVTMNNLHVYVQKE